MRSRTDNFLGDHKDPNTPLTLPEKNVLIVAQKIDGTGSSLEALRLSQPLNSCGGSKAPTAVAVAFRERDQHSARGGAEKNSKSRFQIPAAASAVYKQGKSVKEPPPRCAAVAFHHQHRSFIKGGQTTRQRFFFSPRRKGMKRTIGNPECVCAYAAICVVRTHFPTAKHLTFCFDRVY